MGAFIYNLLNIKHSKMVVSILLVNADDAKNLHHQMKQKIKINASHFTNEF